jgi:hypothetical protein
MKAPSVASAASAPPDEEVDVSISDRASSSITAPQVLQAKMPVADAYVSEAHVEVS